MILDPAPLDAEAARINAKRSSITGEIELPSREQLVSVYSQQVRGAADAVPSEVVSTERTRVQG